MNESLLDAARAAGFAEGTANAGDDAGWAWSIFAGYLAYEHWGWFAALVAFGIVFWLAHRHYYQRYESARKLYDTLYDLEQKAIEQRFIAANAARDRQLDRA